MSNDVPRATLLEEIDARQEELLVELEQLNGRIERVIAEWSAWRGADGSEQQIEKRAA
jgi:hypothetical protein